MTNLLKTTAFALVAIIGTASAASAATAWVDQDAKVRLFHKTNSPTVNWVEEGQKVNVIGQWNNWYKIKVPGQDGWVKANVLDFGAPDMPVNGGSFCVKGDKASFCINASF